MVEYFIDNYGYLEHGFIYLLANYFVASGAVVLFQDFKFGSFRNVIFFILKILLCICVMEFTCSLLYMALPDYVAMNPYILGIFPIAINALLFHKGDKTITLVKSFTYYGMYSLALYITMSVGGLIGLAYSYLQWVLISLNAIIIYSTICFIRYFSVKEGGSYPVPYLLAILIVELSSVAFVFITRIIKIDSAAALILGMLFLFINLVIYFIVSYNVVRANEEAYSRAEELMRESESERLRMSEKNLETMREMRHEIKNQYAYMRVLLENRDFEALGKHLTQYLGKIEQTVSYTDCGNATLNAIICAVNSKAERAGVNTEYKISVPNKLGIEDLDLCSLIINLIDNAVEYIERNKDIADKTVRVRIELVNGTLLVTVENEIKAEHEQTAVGLKTSKAVKEAHGYGSRVVRKIAERYDGYVKYTAENGKFTASAILCEKQII